MTYPFNTVMTWLFSYHPSPARAMVDLDFVCTDQEGKLIRPNFVTEHFDWLLTKYGLKHIRFHDLRHPYVKLTTKNKLAAKAEIPNYQHEFDSLRFLLFCLDVQVAHDKQKPYSSNVTYVS